MHKLQVHQTDDDQLLPREKLVVNFIQNHPGCKSGDIIKGLGISRMIVIRLLSTLIARNLIERHGTGPGTQYTLK